MKLTSRAKLDILEIQDTYDAAYKQNLKSWKYTVDIDLDIRLFVMKIEELLVKSISTDCFVGNSNRIRRNRHKNNTIIFYSDRFLIRVIPAQRWKDSKKEIEYLHEILDDYESKEEYTEDKKISIVTKSFKSQYILF